MKLRIHLFDQYSSLCQVKVAPAKGFQSTSLCISYRMHLLLRLSHLIPVTGTDDRSLSAWHYTKVSGEGKINICLLEKGFWELWEKTTILQYSTETLFLQHNQKYMHKIDENINLELYKTRGIVCICSAIFYCSCYITSHSMQEAVLLATPNYYRDNT